MRDAPGLLITLGGVALIVCMYLRIQAFPRSAWEAVLAAAMGMFVIGRYVGYAARREDHVFALGAAGYMAYFAAA